MTQAANKAADRFCLFLLGTACQCAVFLPPRHFPVEHHEAWVLFFSVSMELQREF